MDIEITTTDKIELLIRGFCEEVTLEDNGGKREKMPIAQRMATLPFASWFFSTTKDSKVINIRSYNLEEAREFKLCFPNKVNELEIKYNGENNISQTKIFNDVDYLFMKRNDDAGFVLTVHVDSEKQISELKDKLSSANQTLAELQADNEHLKININNQQSELDEATHKIKDLENKNKEKEEKLNELKEENKGLKTNEIITLDTNAIQNAINTMKERLEDDQDSAKLLDDLFKQKESITARINDILAKIDGVEKEIGLIARFQELLADKVNKAVDSTNGDGTIDSLTEAGGDICHGKLHSDKQENQEAPGTN